VTYYLALQDRVAEALDWFAAWTAAVPEQLQCDYIEAYLPSIAATWTAREDRPPPRGGCGGPLAQPLCAVLAQLDEAAGGRGVPDKRARPDAGRLAATEPALELQGGGRIKLDYAT